MPMPQMSAHSPALRTREIEGFADLSAPIAMMSWRGASGRAFSHTVYNLIGCPAFASANFVLVKRDRDGRRNVLRVGRTETATASLNLAHIRREGACLGANEVHVYASTASESARASISFDIASAMETSGSQRQGQH